METSELERVVVGTLFLLPEKLEKFNGYKFLSDDLNKLVSAYRETLKEVGILDDVQLGPFFDEYPELEKLHNDISMKYSSDAIDVDEYLELLKNRRQQEINSQQIINIGRALEEATRESNHEKLKKIIESFDFKKSENSRKRMKYIDCDQLMAMDFPEMQWIVQDIIPEGLGMICGSPKIGKSYFGLGIAYYVASGGLAFGKLRTTKGKVLYLGLEDSMVRLQSRMSQVEEIKSSTEYRKNITFVGQGDMPNLENGGLEDLEKWLEINQDAKLIIIDTLEMVRNRDNKKNNAINAYSQDVKACAPLRELASKYHVSILLIHHDTKNEHSDSLKNISGSTGLAGTMDFVLYITRTRGENEFCFMLTGREVKEKIGQKFTFDLDAEPMFYLQGEVDLDVENMSEYSKIIWEFLDVEKTRTLSEIIDNTNLKKTTAKKLLTRMKHDGMIINVNLPNSTKTGWKRINRKQETEKNIPPLIRVHSVHPEDNLLKTEEKSGRQASRQAQELSTANNERVDRVDSGRQDECLLVSACNSSTICTSRQSRQEYTYDKNNNNILNEEENRQEKKRESPLLWEERSTEKRSTEGTSTEDNIPWPDDDDPKDPIGWINGIRL